MASTFTPNIQLEEPARGDDVGTWDTPVNSNMTLLDLVTAGTASITLNNAPVVLSAAQFQCNTLLFGSTLTGNVTVTLPSTFNKAYKVWNTCTGSSAFTITLRTSLAAPSFICPPPGTVASMLLLGGNIVFADLQPVGTYLDLAASTVPNWVSASNPPPFLNCDGTTFSSATYPVLATILGGNTLPDIRGITRATLNQGTGRMTTANGGVDGNTIFARGGLDSVTLTVAQMPAHSHTNTLVDNGHQHFAEFGIPDLSGGTVAYTVGSGLFAIQNKVGLAMTGMSIINGGIGGGLLHINMQPTTVAGLCLIRAA